MSDQVIVTEVDAIRATGSDVSSFLQGQLSQDVVGLSAGEATFSLLLAPQGKLDAWLRVVKISDTEMLLMADHGFGASIVKRLERFKMRVDVAFAQESFRQYSYPVSASEASIRTHHEALGHYLATSWCVGGLDVFETLPSPIDASPGFVVASDTQAAVARLIRGEPAMGFELDESTIPAEAGIVDRSTSFTKGCYTGQELVARVDSRGSNTPRKLRRFEGAGSVPSVGAELLDEAGSVVGTVTSVEPFEQGWVALGYLKRSALERTSVQYEGSTVAIAIPEHMATS